MLAITPSVRNLLILNVLFYFFDANILNLSSRFALMPLLSPDFHAFQFISYMFLHGSIGHLFSNMFGLFMFGPLLERMWGSQKFLFFYFFTGIGAGLLFSGIGYFENIQLREAVELYMEHPTPGNFVDFLSKHASGFYRANLEFISAFEDNSTNPNYIQQSIRMVSSSYEAILSIPMVGASGAIFGILMAFGLLFPNTELFMLFIPFPIKAKYFVTFYGLYELYSGIQNSASDNVAHFAHIGGMLFAYILLRYWGTQKSNFY